MSSTSSALSLGGRESVYAVILLVAEYRQIMFTAESDISSSGESNNPKLDSRFNRQHNNARSAGYVSTKIESNEPKSRTTSVNDHRGQRSSRETFNGNADICFSMHESFISLSRPLLGRVVTKDRSQMQICEVIKVTGSAFSSGHEDAQAHKS
jgi:hypothetical protein